MTQTQAHITGKEGEGRHASAKMFLLSCRSCCAAHLKGEGQRMAMGWGARTRARGGVGGGGATRRNGAQVQGLGGGRQAGAILVELHHEVSQGGTAVIAGPQAQQRPRRGALPRPLQDAAPPRLCAPASPHLSACYCVVAGVTQSFFIVARDLRDRRDVLTTVRDALPSRLCAPRQRLQLRVRSSGELIACPHPPQPVQDAPRPYLRARLTPRLSVYDRQTLASPGFHICRFSAYDRLTLTD